jgi:hypothetical protein
MTSVPYGTQQRPRAPEKRGRPVTRQEIAMIRKMASPTVRNADIARVIGRTAECVQQYRARLDLPKFAQWARKGRCMSSIRTLWTMPDTRRSTDLPVDDARALCKAERAKREASKWDYLNDAKRMYADAQVEASKRGRPGKRRGPNIHVSSWREEA